MSEWHDEVEKMPDKIIYLFLIFFFKVKDENVRKCRDEIRHHWGYNTAQAIKKWFN